MWKKDVLFNETKHFFKNPDITEKVLVTESDKGKNTVVLYKEDYNRAMNLILSDRCKFLHCRKDTTKEIQQKAEKLVNKLKLKGFLSDREAKKLHRAPRIYGLPKTHKSLRDDSGNLQLKLRPIVSFINSPLYNISKYLANILSKVNEDNVYVLKKSYECVDKLKNVILPPNYLTF
jgi:hypothetical protein